MCIRNVVRNVFLLYNLILISPLHQGSIICPSSNSFLSFRGFQESPRTCTHHDPHVQKCCLCTKGILHHSIFTGNRETVTSLKRRPGDKLKFYIYMYLVKIWISHIKVHMWSKSSVCISYVVWMGVSHVCGVYMSCIYVMYRSAICVI